MKKEMNNKGFSLVELIIVIAIMAVLVGILAPQYLKYVHNSKVSTDVTNAQEMATAINTAIADKGSSFTPASTSTADICTAAGITAPTTKLGGTYTITYTITDGVTNIQYTGVTNGAATAVSSFEVYPNPDNTTDGANQSYTGVGLKK